MTRRAALDTPHSLTKSQWQNHARRQGPWLLTHNSSSESTCATWPGRWENHGQDKAVGCRCLEVFAKEAVIMVIWSEPLPLPPRILRVYNWRVLQGPGALPIPQLALQPQEGGICSPGGHRWEAVRLSRLWSTHCSIWLERKCQPPLPFGERTRDCSPGHAGKEGPQLAPTLT